MYPESFFQHQVEDTAGSAKALISEILRHVSPKSVLDVGCGVGVWVDEFKRRGIAEVMGVDQPQPMADGLRLIHPPEFLEQDLEQPLQIHRTFDLVVCLETIEHLSENRGPKLVRELTQLGPVILFSGAVPLQCGYYHINEQWPDYWQREFAKWNYLAVDCIRPRVWNNPAIAWWYRQNTIFYVHESCSPKLFHSGASQSSQPLMRLIHPEMWAQAVSFINADLVPDYALERNPRLRDLHDAARGGQPTVQKYLANLLV
jgi:SAM-dependent methyltransferase